MLRNQRARTRRDGGAKGGYQRAHGLREDKKGVGEVEALEEWAEHGGEAMKWMVWTNEKE